eukprot:COSAG01_NODE_33997_length_555_cov_0.855263_1_plen_141_part_10
MDWHTFAQHVHVDIMTSPRVRQLFSLWRSAAPVLYPALCEQMIREATARGWKRSQHKAAMAARLYPTPRAFARATTRRESCEIHALFGRVPDRLGLFGRVPDRLGLFGRVRLGLFGLVPDRLGLFGRCRPRWLARFAVRAT